MRPKIEYLECLIQIDEARKQVSEVLEKSIKDTRNNPSAFVQRYMDSQSSSGDKPYSTMETAIAALSAQLLTVQSLTLSRKVKKLEYSVKAKREIIEQAQQKKRQKEEVLRQRRAQHEEKVRKLKESFSARKKELQKRLTESKTLLMKTNTLLDNQQARLFQTLCKLILVKKYLIKGQSQGRNHQLSISFHPVLAVDKIIQYRAPLVTASLELVCHFLHYASYYLLIDLPFRIDLPREGSEMKYVIHGLRENFDGLFFNVKIDKKYVNQSKSSPIAMIPQRNLWLILNGYSYDQTFNSKNQVLLKKPLLKLNTVEVFEFAITIAKIILNLYVMNLKLNIISEGSNSFDTYSKLFKMDEMLYLLITGGNRLNRPVKGTRSVSNDSSFILERKNGLQTFLKEQLVAPKRSVSMTNDTISKPVKRSSSILRSFWRVLENNEGFSKQELEESEEANEDVDFGSYIEINLELDKRLEDYGNYDQVVAELSLADLSYRIFTLLHNQASILSKNETMRNDLDSENQEPDESDLHSSPLVKVSTNGSVSTTNTPKRKSKKKQHNLLTSTVANSPTSRSSRMSEAGKERNAYYGDRERESINSNDWQMI